MNNPAPVVLFVFSRPEHTRHTLEALRANTLAYKTDLIVYADAARTETDEINVQQVRDIVNSTQGFRTITVIERTHNFGLANNIIDGVTNVCAQFGRVIVLEDDLVTSPYFLTYMNEALELYEDDQRVASIHGYCYPVKAKLPETFFIKGADCWGWATWKRAWSHFNPNGTELLEKIKNNELTNSFDYNSSYPFTEMLQAQINGKNNSWAIRWHASIFLLSKLTLYPGKSLVHNIGNDSSGTHCVSTNSHDVSLTDRPIRLGSTPIKESIIARKAFEDFFKETHSKKHLTQLAKKVLLKCKSFFYKTS